MPANNITFNNNEYIVLDNKEALPVISRIGIAYQLLYKKQYYLPNLYLMGFTFHGEYQNILNYEYLSTYSLGFEFSLFEIFYTRFGYYSSKLNAKFNSKNKLTDFTFGFGINLPINEFVKQEIPFIITFDITNLQQPSYIKNYDDWEKFSVYSLGIKWLILNEK